MVRFNEIGLTGTGLDGSLEHSSLLNRSGTTGNANDNARLRLPRVLPLRGLVDEGRQHGLGHIVVGNNAVLQRMFGSKGIGSVVDHVLGLVANRQHAVGALLYGNHGRLVDNDALTSDSHQRIGGSEVDGHIGGHLPGQTGKEIKKGHWAITFLLYWFTDLILVLTISA